MGDDGNLYVADGTYFYVVRADGSLETVGMLFSPGYPGFVRGLAATGPGEFVVTTSGGQLARYRPGANETDYLATDFDQLYGVAIGAGRHCRIRRTRHRSRACPAIGQRRDPGVRPCVDPVGVAFDPDGRPLVAESGAGRVVRLSGSSAETVVGRIAAAARHRRRRRSALHRRCRRQGSDRVRPQQQGASYDRVRPSRRTSARRGTQTTEGNAAVLRTAGALRGHRRGPRRHSLRFGGR